MIQNSFIWCFKKLKVLSFQFCFNKSLEESPKRNQDDAHEKLIQDTNKLKAKVKTLERGAETHEQALQTTKARLNEVCEQKDSLVSENARLHELVVHLTQKHQKVLRGQEDADVDDSVSSDEVPVEMTTDWQPAGPIVAT